jgi:N-acetylneuraminic acid mutarotase
MRRHVILISVILVTAGLLSFIPVSVAEEDKWTKKADVPTARAMFPTCAVNGLIYAMGGWTNAGGFFQTVEAYDPNTDTWEKKANMPSARDCFPAVAVNGAIYAIGGGNGGAMSVVEAYDPVKDAWERRSNMPTSRWALSASDANGIIYAIGGGAGQAGGLAPLSTVEAYNPETDKWEEKADMPTPRDALSSSTVNGKIYAIGGRPGYPGRGTPFSTVEEYDPKTDKWTQKTDMPTPRWGLSTCVVNGKIYAIGGNNGNAPLSTMEIYDPVTDKWIKETDMPTARYDFSASVVNGKIYAIGGHGVAVEEYDTGFTPPRSVDSEGKLAVKWGDIKRGS